MLRALFLVCAFAGAACGATPEPMAQDAFSLLQTGATLEKRSSLKPTKSEQLAHWVIVTDCSAYMFNQGNLMLASAYHVGQPGNFTWIVYGCTRNEQEQAFSKIVHPTANVWHMKESDLIDPSTGKPYPAFQASNRPVAVYAWYKAVQPKEQAIAIIDPDMYWLRPVHLYNEPTEQHFERWSTSHNATKENNLPWETFAARPKHGSGARYGQGCIPHQFTDEQISSICGPEHAERCNAARQDFDTCATNFSSGPPWILHTSDAEDILGAWTDIAVKVHQAYPEMLAEQVSYGVTQMKFSVGASLDSFWFLSDTDDTSQPWEPIAALDWDPCASRELPPPVKEVAPLWHACATYHLHGNAMLHMDQVDPENATGQVPPPDDVDEMGPGGPGVGKWNAWLHKDHIHKDLLDCDAPLLRYPPRESLLRYGLKNEKGHENSRVFRETWGVCTFTNTVNFYASMWKNKFCKSPNLSATFEYPPESMGFVNNGTWLERVFRRGGWSDVDYKVGDGSGRA